MGIQSDHIERVRVAVLRRDSMSTLTRWITEKTYIGGRNYSFKDHEYQEFIGSQTAKEVNVQKPSQVGVSELSARLALAMVSVVRPMTAIYTLPTAKFAATFMRTRIDPIIQGSKTLRQAIHRSNDNADLKQIGDSFLYLKGSASGNAPISIPADIIINDEMDFSDQEILAKYTSRLTHSPWKMFRRFSTPTVPDYGINRAFKNSRRFVNLCKCNHCNFWFAPDYYKHVAIPNFLGDLREITKVSLASIKWEEATLVCPSCGKQPSLQIEHRRWVCENPGEDLVGVGIQVTPFDAPNIIKCSDLVMASTNYTRIQDFSNFSLGLPMEDQEATLLRVDFEGHFVRGEAGGTRVRVMGVDVGKMYHFTISEPTQEGLHTVHRESVPLGLARARYHQLRQQYRVICTVMDSQPHAETVMALQSEDPNLFAAVYVKSKSLNTHVVVDKDEDKDVGKNFIRQVNINRNRAFDGYMGDLREHRLSAFSSNLDEMVIAHHISMKRVRQFDADSGDVEFSWQKTDGEDHFHHSAVYAWIASKIKGVSRTRVRLPFMITSFKAKSTA
jgi:hypothetical protein